MRTKNNQFRIGNEKLFFKPVFTGVPREELRKTLANDVERFLSTGKTIKKLKSYAQR